MKDKELISKIYKQLIKLKIKLKKPKQPDLKTSKRPEYIFF